ncbi:rod shape-determining protein RodA [Bacteroidota bacterium]
MKINYKISDKIDFYILIPLIILIALGLITILSATINHPTASGNFNKQLYWSILSFGILFIIYFLPPQFFKAVAIPSFIITQVLLILVLLMGTKIYGAKSWLIFGPVGFQPSEFAKIGIILFLAYLLTRRKVDINKPINLFITILLSAIPILLILFQPDMGTAVVCALIALIMIYWSGLSLFGIFVVISPLLVIFASLFGIAVLIAVLVGVLVALIAFNKDLFTSATVFVANIAAGFIFDIFFNFLKPHQQRRIEAFIDPNADPLGSGYNALQAKVAIGSGGVLGKGFMEGNQTQLKFIPEQWTDFIFCVVGEEFGFIGSIIVIVLFLVIFFRLLNLTYIISDKFGNIIIIGIWGLLFTQFAINIGMNLGITPVVGLPLPFLSYGGSSLLTNMILIGLVLNIYKNRKIYI